MAKAQKVVTDPTLLSAALEGLEIQRQRVEEQIRQVSALLGKRVEVPVAGTAAPKGRRGRKRILSAAAKERISAAQKKRWAAFHKKKAGKK